ncbi:MAG: alpha-N-arabinofuranosidase, partial [Maribacter arcticus]
MDKHFLKSGAILILVGYSQLISAQTKIEIVSIENTPIISKHIYGHFAEHLGRSIYEGFYVG